jgi:hypothetical protein
MRARVPEPDQAAGTRSGGENARQPFAARPRRGLREDSAHTWQWLVTKREVVTRKPAPATTLVLALVLAWVP